MRVLPSLHLQQLDHAPSLAPELLDRANTQAHLQLLSKLPNATRIAKELAVLG